MNFTKKEITAHINIPEDLFALLTNRILFMFAFGLVGIFFPIFFYELFNKSIYPVLIIYALMSLVRVFIIPFGARLIGVLGIKKMIMLAVIPAVISLSALHYVNIDAVLASSVFVLFIAIYSVLYWIPYHIDFAVLIKNRRIGSSVATYKNIIQIVSTLSPFISGMIITMIGFKDVFALSAFIILFSIWPARYIKQVYERYSWDYLETFRQLFSKKNRQILKAYTADGAQGIVSVVIWPIFIFELLDGNYISVGLITSFTIIIILMINFVLGILIDKFGEESIIKYGTFFTVTGWIFKVFVDSTMQMFLIDTYHKLGQAVGRMGFDAATYTYAADNGHYIDEYTALKEISLNIGRLLMLLTIFGLVHYFNIRVVFIVAAISTIFMTALGKEILIHK